MVSVFVIPGGILRVPDRIRYAELLADPTWPRLKDGKPVREAVEYLEYGKDNYRTREKLMKLVMEAALSIFKMVFNSKKSQRVLAFDNAANHCAYKLDALLASRMSLSPGDKQALLREGFDYDCGLPHTMVFPGNHPNRKLHGKAKGLQQVFTEHDLWPYKSKRSDGMKFLLLCPTSFGRPSCHLLEEMPETACCATKVMSLQQDFKEQQGWVDLFILFIYSSYSHATIRLWRRLHILITLLSSRLLPRVPTGMRPRAVFWCRVVVSLVSCRFYSPSRVVCSKSPVRSEATSPGRSPISSTLPLPCLAFFPPLFPPRGLGRGSSRGRALRGYLLPEVSLRVKLH
jgi:hypothetical protein